MALAFWRFAALFCVVFVASIGRAADVPAKAVGIGVLSNEPDVAWPLARDAYANPTLKPSFDEATARVLAGEPPAADAPQAVKDIADLRAIIKGDDAASRELLASLSQKLGTKGMVVVTSGTARLFLVDGKSFDAASYTADAQGSWAGTVTSLARQLAPPPAPPVLQPVAPVVPKPAESKPFYLSPWFWVAAGVAVALGVTIFFATQDQSGGMINLKLAMPQ